MSQTNLRREIVEFSQKEDLDNKRCIDCNDLHPQWASANNAVLLCIQCAGVHRGFGVHISYVRSVTMDNWKPEEVAKMKLGGNKPFRQFLSSYSPPAGSIEWTYDTSMHANAKTLYESWPAHQYREKLSFDLDGKSWSPSAPSAQFLAAQTSRPPSAQSLRTRSQNRPPSHSPSPLRTSAPQSRDGDSETGISDVKSIKENWFAGLGAANAERPDHLPPSQGGRYAGFGSTPEPPPEALALSSKALPTFQDVQNDPGAALSKGWSFLSTAFVSASKAVNETIIQPGMQVAKENAPVVQKSVGQFAATATQSMGQLSGQVKEKTGVDVAEGWGTLVDKVKAIGIAGQTPEQRGYSGVDDGWGEHEEEGSALYRDEPDSADFFTQFESPSQPGAGASKDSNKDSSTTPKPAQIQAQEVEKEGWDDWKEF